MMAKKDLSSLSDLFEESFLDDLFTPFRVLTGLPVALMDVDGECVYSQNKRVPERCRLCRLIQDTDEGADNCQEEFARAGQEAARWGEPYFYECWLGLMEWSIALIVEDQTVGSIVCGQTLVEGQESAFRKALRERCEEIGVPVRSAERAAKDIPIVSPGEMKAMGKMLALLAGQISGTSEVMLEERRRHHEHQRRIAEEIQARKRDGVGAIYPLDLEKQLIAHVRLGEVEEAKALLNHLLGAIFFRDMGSTTKLKARLIELLAQLSRAAVEAGADLDATLGANLEWLNRLNACETQEQMCECLREALDRFTESVYASRNTEQMRILSEAMQFARERYHESISLTDVARAVHRNSSTLRKLFREQLGVTFTEYLNKARVEASEELLKDPNLSLAQIAVDVGFYDQSHFGKVFRNLTGYTPAAYRRKIL